MQGQVPTDNMSYGEAVNFAYERMRIINEMPLQKEMMQASGQQTPFLLDSNEMHPDLFKLHTNGSVPSNHTASAFNGLKTYNPNEQFDNSLKQNEQQFGESFGKPDSISEGSTNEMKLRSYHSIKSFQSNGLKQVSTV